MRPLRMLSAAFLTCSLALTGCGGSTEGSASGGGSVTVQAGNGAVTIPAVPKRIVSLSPTATEMLFAIGAGPQVTAVDDQSDHPPNAPKTSLSGFKPNAEAVIGHKPDLVVLSNDTDGIVKNLEKVGVPVLLEPAAATLDEVYDQINDLGTATGRADRAKAVTDAMRRDIAAAVASASEAGSKKGPTYYHELTNDLHSVTSKTFIGQVYGMFGLVNIADEAAGSSDGYPKLSREYVVKADPALIFLADTECCGQSAATVAKRPGWQDLTAVKNGAVVELDDDVASRWGPRVVDLVKAIGAAVQKAPTAE